MRITEKIKKLLTDKPFIKTIMFFGSVIISGILCSAFVTEITINGTVVWSNFSKATSFWIIILYIIIIYLYNKITYTIDSDIKKYLDLEYCRSYAIKACLPEIAERLKQDIKEGKNISEIFDFDEFLKKVNK